MQEDYNIFLLPIFENYGLFTDATVSQLEKILKSKYSYDELSIIMWFCSDIENLSIEQVKDIIINELGEENETRNSKKKK